MSESRDVIMENGEIQRQMNFVVTTLAEITTKISSLTASQSRTDATVAALAGQFEHMVRQQTHMNEVVAVMAESLQHTDERLSALIDIVRNDRNGKSQA